MNNEQGQLNAVKDALRRVAERLDEMSRAGTSHAASQGKKGIWRSLAIVGDCVTVFRHKRR